MYAIQMLFMFYNITMEIYSKMNMKKILIVSQNLTYDAFNNSCT